MQRPIKTLGSILMAFGLIALAAAQTQKIVRFPRQWEVGVGASTQKWTVHIWLPKGYSRSSRYPAIFTFADQGELVAQVAAYYSQALHQIPPAIVVGIEVEVDDIGYHYETVDVSEEGKWFDRFWSDQMLPYLDKSYPLARFRAYLGHSYGASYTDYLLKTHPSWFNGYALIAPEQPAYRLDRGPLLERLPSPFSLYLASASGDVERRQEHARLLADQFGAFQGKDFRFRHDVLPGADHLTSVPQAIPGALEFLFSSYRDFSYPDTDGDLTQWFASLQRRKVDLYGRGIEADSSNAAYFMGLAAERKDLRALATFEKFFATDRADASILFNTAQTYLSLGDDAHAERLFWHSVARAKATKQGDFLLMAYRTLALRVYSERRQDPAKAWDTLEKGQKATSDVAFEYFFGLVSARHGYRLDDGIRYLKAFEKDRDRTYFGSLYRLDGVYANLAKCYLLKGDQAQAGAYVERALRENSANEDAAALRKSLPITFGLPL